MTTDIGVYSILIQFISCSGTWRSCNANQINWCNTELKAFSKSGKAKKAFSKSRKAKAKASLSHGSFQVAT